MFRAVFLALSAAILSSAAAASTLSFTNVRYTANSVSFDVNGDLTGYAYPSFGSIQFSVRYGGDIVATPDLFSIAANSWSNTVFDGVNFNSFGYTGKFSGITPYSWSQYDRNLTGAVATNRAVTLTLAQDYLDVTASNPRLIFLWGNGLVGSNGQGDATILGEYVATPVPIPAPPGGALLGGALLLGGSFLRTRRRRG